jgi:hypothetical protein
MHFFICPNNDPVNSAVRVPENTTCLLILTHSKYDVPGSDLCLQTGHLNLKVLCGPALSLQDQNYTHSLLCAGSHFMVF